MLTSMQSSLRASAILRVVGLGPAKLASKLISSGRNQLVPRNLAKPTGVWRAAMETEASMASTSVVATGAMQRRDAVGRRRAVVAELPLVG